MLLYSDNATGTLYTLNNMPDQGDGKKWLIGKKFDGRRCSYSDQTVQTEDWAAQTDNPGQSSDDPQLSSDEGYSSAEECDDVRSCSAVNQNGQLDGAEDEEDVVALHQGPSFLVLQDETGEKYYENAVYRQRAGSGCGHKYNTPSPEGFSGSPMQEMAGVRRKLNFDTKPPSRVSRPKNKRVTILTYDWNKPCDKMKFDAEVKEECNEVKYTLTPQQECPQAQAAPCPAAKPPSDVFRVEMMKECPQPQPGPSCGARAEEPQQCPKDEPIILKVPRQKKRGGVKKTLGQCCGANQGSS